MKQKNLDYIVLKYDEQPNVLLCERCGVRYPVGMPCSFKMFAAIGKVFEEQHKKCKVRA